MLVSSSSMVPVDQLVGALRPRVWSSREAMLRWIDDGDVGFDRSLASSYFVRKVSWMANDSLDC